MILGYRFLKTDKFQRATDNGESFSNATGRYYQNESNDYPKSISYQQLLVLHVAAHYELRRSSMRWGVMAPLGSMTLLGFTHHPR
jgi:hypothetical protein